MPQLSVKAPQSQTKAALAKQQAAAASAAATTNDASELETDNENQLDEDNDEQFAFQDIDLLQQHGINVADIKKLQAVGICTIKGVMMTTKKRMCEIKGLSEAKVDKIKEMAGKLMVSSVRRRL
jgi:hypothetical protein